MKLAQLFERSSVIKKDGFAILQTALSLEQEDNMNTRSAQACLLNSFAEAIRQQTGLSISRIDILDDLSIEKKFEDKVYYNTYRYHDLNELISHVTNKGVIMFNSDQKRQRFIIKLHPVKSIADIKKQIDDGISVLMAFQRCDIETDAEERMSKLHNFTQKELENPKLFKNQFEKIVDTSVSKTYAEKARAAYRGIIPLADNVGHLINGYHGVIVVGYDETDNVFIFKDIRDHYMLNGMAKIPVEYFERYLSGKDKQSTFVRTVVGLEAEALK